MQSVDFLRDRAKEVANRPPLEAARRTARRDTRRAALGAAGALTVALLWSYAPTLEAMVERWWSDPQYSHGFLVPVFAAAVLWSRRERWDAVRWQPSWWGLPVLAA